jgi:multidrug efflux pump subunit AcrB
MSRESLSADDISTITVPNQQNEQVTMAALGELKLIKNPTIISRLDGKRSITITADVLSGFNTVELGQDLLNYVNGDLKMPTGYITQTGGVNEENQESITSIMQAMVIALILIMGTMVVQLQSFRKAIIVMLVIPLAVTGVFIIFAVLGIPLSFASLIGVLALFGIVVKNSIMIVDKINRNLKVGLPFNEAVTDGATSRLEPIFFSSITNIIGLIPITISDPFWRGLGGAIIAGLSMSGIIMLVFIPVVYYTWFADEYKEK